MLPKSYIQQGSRITYMTTHKFNLRFVDTLNFFLCPLADLSKTYDIKTVKGHFPHHFNIPRNQNYIGKIPAESEFGARSMKPDKYIEFKKWYDEVKDVEWDFKHEFESYCQADVDVLAEAVCKFREIFMKLDVDPWRYVTLPSLCKDMYINKFMPEKTIVGNTSNKPVSRVSKE